MKTFSWLVVALAVAALVVASPLAAQGIVNSTINGNDVSFGISLPGGLGADVSLHFEQVVGLSVANLGLSAAVVNPLDLSLLSRLGGLSIPAGFPVLLRIEPPASGGLSFSGVVSIDLHTHNLNFVPLSPLRLYAAPLGGSFEDITQSIGMGSYRVCGTKGGFSEFLILVDLRSVDRVIRNKFNRLDGLLNDNGALIDPTVLADLTSLLQDARTAYQGGSTLVAIQKVEAFAALVKSHSGADIPDVWRSSRDLVNVAGLLRAAAGTLRFSLNMKASGAP
jgi:uncharacterized protein DUF6689